MPPEYVDMLDEHLASLSQRHARIALHQAITLIDTGRYTAATWNYGP